MKKKIDIYKRCSSSSSSYMLAGCTANTQNNNNSNTNTNSNSEPQQNETEVRIPISNISTTAKFYSYDSEW